MRNSDVNKGFEKNVISKQIEICGFFFLIKITSSCLNPFQNISPVSFVLFFGLISGEVTTVAQNVTLAAYQSVYTEIC